MPECPIDCPNRANPTAINRGKVASYLFALIASLFLAHQCLLAEKQNREISPIVWMPTLILIGTALGVNIDPASVATLIKK